MRLYFLNTLYKDVFQKSHVNVITISFIVHNALQICMTDDDNSVLLIGSYKFEKCVKMYNVEN